MTLSQNLQEHIYSCFTALWVQSHEHEDALADIAKLCHDEQWHLAVWDAEQGLRTPGKPGDAQNDTSSADPLAAIRSINTLADQDHSVLLVLTNFHRYLASAEIVQALSRQIELGKHNRSFVIVLSPVVVIPVELEKRFVVLEHDLPSREQLEEIAGSIAIDAELPTGDGLDRVLDAAAGLTRFEAEGAFSLSIYRHTEIRPNTIWELKSGMLKKSGLLSLHHGNEAFGELGGLNALKAFCLRAMRVKKSANSIARPRGVLLLSPPGCGKSQFCKALGNETGRPTLILDIGTLMGPLVGATEQRTREALKIADAMAPCVLMVDEIEKALSGLAASGKTDSGTSARLFGTLLTWLNDHTSDVFFVATCNDISKLPPEMTRAERFDGCFFVDLPSAEQRAAIWSIYLEHYKLDSDQLRPCDEAWTGAEIKSCCRLAALLDVPLEAAAQNVVPIAATAAESVAKLRRWASGRCLSADAGGIYRHVEKRRRRRRSTPPDPSLN